MQVRSWKWRFTTRRVSRHDVAEWYGPKYQAPSSPKRRTTSSRGHSPSGIEAQHQEVLVVLEVDVEAGLVTLDERVLQQQRLFFVRGDDGFDVGDDPLEQGDEVAGVARGRLEVLADAVAQHRRLADVDRLAAHVLHDVDAGRRGQAVEDLGDALARRRDLAFAKAEAWLWRILGHER